MAIRTSEEIIASLSGIIQDINTDSALSLMEDIRDSVNNDAASAEAVRVEMQAKLDENDASWRARYAERFTKPDDTPPVEPATEPPEDDYLNTDYNKLFTEVK